MLLRTFIAIICGSIFVLVVDSEFRDRYDFKRMPIDLTPVQTFIGLWEKEKDVGIYKQLPPPDMIDYAIHPLPKFGARCINITHNYYDKDGHVLRSDYGFMPVKNATRRDPRVHVAYLTTSSEGFSMMEQGFVKGGSMAFHFKSFLPRSFDVANNGMVLDIREYERKLELIDGRHMKMLIRAETAYDTEEYTAYYKKIMP
uniref:THAP4_heme-bd domain-containing protein n=1 Tax=Parastrongyloides trichosuri TaxID=131310 RepID=A0A0N4Z9U3_PARTI